MKDYIAFIKIHIYVKIYIKNAMTLKRLVTEPTILTARATCVRV